MKRMTTIELREKAVINLTDGAQLGYACDFELDICDGKILSIIIPGERGFFGGCRSEDIIIPWCKIECFGEDTILVKLAPQEYCFSRDRRKGRSKCK